MTTLEDSVTDVGEVGQVCKARNHVGDSRGFVSSQGRDGGGWGGGGIVSHRSVSMCESRDWQL